jgi:hypothetical protein
MGGKQLLASEMQVQLANLANAKDSLARTKLHGQALSSANALLKDHLAELKRGYY